MGNSFFLKMDYRTTLHAIPPCHPSYASRNCLLVKDDVGKSKPSCRDLPGSCYSYGAPINPDKEGVRELISKWTFHQSVARPQEQIQDFRRLNKLATKQGISDARDQTVQRLSRKDITVQPTRYVNPATAHPFDHQLGHIYGRPPRPSSPMDRVMAHDYGREGQEKTALDYERYDVIRAENSRPIKYRVTNASRGHAIRAVHRRSLDGHHSARGTLQQPFKMSKFSEIAPRTNTYLVNEMYATHHPKSGVVLTDCEVTKLSARRAEAQVDEVPVEEVLEVDA
eukprot:GDKJ01040206.1.p1 GENE.GDKJ01040206.1~~GDKJ01040206.1.p1  ORF type:complete len:282 (+),score=49.94 GDKJ01040206.1:1-846(+)